MSDIFGAIGVLLIILSFGIKDDKYMLGCLSAGCVLYGIQFGLKEMWFPALLQLVTVVRLWVAMRIKSLKAAHGFAFIYLFLLSQTWTGEYNLLPLFAALISTYASLLFQGVKMRLILLIPSFLWLIHNIEATIVNGIILEILVITINGFTIFRLMNENKKAQI